MAFKSSLRAAACVGMALSLISLAAHFLLARYYTGSSSSGSSGSSEMQGFVFLRWRASMEEPDGKENAKAWSSVKALQFLRPHASPREQYHAPPTLTTGYLFAEIKGDFHQIRSSICDLVVIARFLNVTLLIPRLKDVAPKKSSLRFKGFDYIYDEDHFISALSNDVHVVKQLPAKYRARRTLSFIVKYPSSSATVSYYLQEVLPGIKREGVVGLSVSGGGCLQSLLPPELEEYQRLRCRVAFHALRFRREIQALATKMATRLRSSGKPYIALFLGLDRDTLAFHGCAERFQDVHTEIIQSIRAKMVKNRIVEGPLNIDSEQQWLNGSCPIMPNEVAVLLQAVGFQRSSRIYIPGVELFGGQRVLLPLRSVFPNTEDRTTLSTAKERSAVSGEEEEAEAVAEATYRGELLPKVDEKARLEAWAKAGPRPRPLPPPAGRPRYPHEVQGWWAWVGETPASLAAPPPPQTASRTASRTAAARQRLLWQALDYILCTQADVFFSAFDHDAAGLPGFSSQVMGQRTYAAPWMRTYRPDRSEVAALLARVSGRLSSAGADWLAAARRSLLRSAGAAGLQSTAQKARPRSFLAHPLPECVCRLAGATATAYDGGAAATCPLQTSSSPPLLTSSEEADGGDEYSEEAADGEDGLDERSSSSSSSSSSKQVSEDQSLEGDKAEDAMLNEAAEDDNDPND